MNTGHANQTAVVVEAKRLLQGQNVHSLRNFAPLFAHFAVSADRFTAKGAKNLPGTKSKRHPKINLRGPMPLFAYPFPEATRLPCAWPQSRRVRTDPLVCQSDLHRTDPAVALPLHPLI